MGKLIMVIGGKRSGKSDFAQGLAEGFGDSILYIATLVPEDDEEVKSRIAYRKAMRPSGWDTLEIYDGIAAHIAEFGGAYDGIVLDRISVMVTQLLGAYNESWESVPLSAVLEIEKTIQQETRQVVKAAKSVSAPVIIITNELGMGSRPADRFHKIRRDITCRVNTKLAAQADEVYFMMAGIPMKIK
ncbi:MAG: bifunctional adenosylcobinamide kinase/adenosylcobinamide-phosphate guanylyltransferase [Ruminococcaceae bacterium]|nr:bifunctional adenosylcobinamide kinase/adenosylcobinamide-phosphate guanylyltransferase [Oscillospiraceae bacterium]